MSLPISASVAISCARRSVSACSRAVWMAAPAFAAIVPSSRSVILAEGIFPGGGLDTDHADGLAACHDGHTQVRARVSADRCVSQFGCPRLRCPD